MPSDRDFEARETAVGQAIRRGWPIIAVLMLAALATSLVMTSRREPTYEATAELLISPLGQHETTFRGTDLLREAGDPAETGGTVAALIETNDAAAATARSVGGGWTAAEVLDAVEIEPVESTQVLSVKATADNPATAAALATEFARSTVRLRGRRIVPQIEERLEGLVERRRAAPLDDYSQRDRLFTEIRLLEDTLAGGGDPTLTFVDAAATPTAEAATSRVLIALVAMLGGLALGVVVAIVVERLRRSARTEQDLLAARPLPILARLPGGSRGTASVGPDQIGALAVQLERLGNFDQRVVLVTSACRGDGRTTVATNLAVALANSGHSTILVDLDDSAPSVAEWLMTVGRVEDFRLQRPDARNLGVRQQVEAAKDVADWVVIHAPPVLEGAEALKAAGEAGDVIFVARLGRTDRREYGRALAMLERAGAPLTGLVVMGSSSRRRPRRRADASRPPMETEAAGQRPSVHR